MNWRETGYFAAHRLIGSHVADYFREFMELHRGTAAQLDNVRDKRLGELLSHATKGVPFYRERVSKKSSTLEDFPVIKKDDLTRYFTDFMVPKLKSEYESSHRAKGYSWIPVKSGGTSGVPVTVIHDRDFRDRGRASRLFSQYLCGFPLGTPHFLLCGSMKEINEMRDSWSRRALDFFQNPHLLNAFRMDEKRLEEYVRLINESRIEHMMAYVDAACELVRFSRRRELPLRKLKSFMACAGTVNDDVRQLLTDGLAEHVHNKYGTRECTDMACEDDAGRINIYSHHVYLEAVDEANRPVKPGTLGRLLVTLLGNHSFPLIRYEVGDMCVLAAGRSSSGSPWPQFDRIEGRVSDFVCDSSGNYVSPVYIRHLIGVVHNPEAIERYQLRQLTRTDFELLLQLTLETGEDKADKITKSIERDLKAVLGAEASLQIRRVPEIEHSASGKFVYIQNLYTKPGS
jgi:phenylacetate-CoA ligase